MSNPIKKDKMTIQQPLNKAGILFAEDKALFFVAAMLAFVVMLSWAALNRIEKQVRSDIQENLQKVLETSHEKLENWIDHRIEDSLLVVDRPDVRRLIKELLVLPRNKETLVNRPAQQQLREIVKPFLEKNSDLGLFVIAPDGTNVASMQDTNLGQINFLANSSHSYLQNMLKGEPQIILPMISDVSLPAMTGKPAQRKPTMFIGVPVKDDGSIIAAFTIRIDPALDFSKLINSARTGMTGDSYVFDNNGRLLSESRFVDQLRTIGLIKEDERAILNLMLLDPGGNLLEGFQTTTPRGELPLTLMAQKATAGESGYNIDGYRDYRGVPVVGFWSWHGKTHFGQAFEIDVAEAYRSYFHIRFTVIGLLSITALLFLGFAINMLRQKRQTEVINRQLAQEVVERQKSEERIRVLVDSSPDGMIIVNKVGNITWVNRQTETLFGYQSEELLGKKIELLIPTRFAENHPKHRNAYFANPYIRRIGGVLELSGLCKNGNEFPVELFLRAITTGGETIAVASIRDVSERKRVEEEVRLRSERLSRHNSALQKLARINFAEFETAIAATTEKAAIAFDVNRFSVWLFNKDFSELICSDLFILKNKMHEQGAVLKRTDFPNYFEAVEDARLIAADDAHNDPSTRDFTEVYLKPLGITSMLDAGIFKHSKLVGVVCAEHVGPQRKWEDEELTFIHSIADIVTLCIESSERHRAERELEKHKELLEEVIEERTRELSVARKKAEAADAAKGIFLSNVSHELRTPMNGIIGNTYLLQQSGLSKKQNKYAADVQKNAKGLTKIIDSILDFSKFDEDLLVLESEQFSLEDILSPVFEEAEINSEQKGISLIVSKKDLPLELEGDGEKLAIIFSYLLDNAIKYTDQGEIVVQLEGEELDENTMFLHCAVIDSGIGMDKALVDNLFQSFTQGDGSSTRKYGGLGLGLTLCKKQIEQLRGTLSVASELGQGTIVSFTVQFIKVAASETDKAVSNVAQKDRLVETETAEVNFGDIDVDRLATQVIDLGALLQKGDMEADTLFSEIKMTLLTVDQDNTKKMMKKLDSFDFKGAFQNLLAIQAILINGNTEREEHG